MDFKENYTHKEYASKSKANTALGLSIAALALPFVQNGGLNILNGGQSAASTAQANTCSEIVNIYNGMWTLAYNGQNARFEDRQVLNQELFNIYDQGVKADFELYKTTRNGFDITNARVSELEKHVAVLSATRPYQDALIASQIERVAIDAQYNLDRRTCRMISGEVVLPKTPTVTGYPSYSPCPTAK